MPLQADHAPLQVEAMDGEVVITGPRVAVALTAAAAAETARRIAEAAATAGAFPVQPLAASQGSASDL
ncbi:hypothetical protein ACFODL_06310 [Phenylobacterium terrae]|uniref:Uncharacterized protein n=1 Tax=Phenylobacterium terrae TaxID=2665495 RepID=A0ABW4N5V1_9CAUL